jgi:shikimate 5-dehydrogenase
VPIESRDLEAARGRRSIGLRGASVTIPFKRDVMPLLDEVAPTRGGAARSTRSRSATADGSA